MLARFEAIAKEGVRCNSPFLSEKERNAWENRKSCFAPHLNISEQNRS